MRYLILFIVLMGCVSPKDPMEPIPYATAVAIKQDIQHHKEMNLKLWKENKELKKQLRECNRIKANNDFLRSEIWLYKQSGCAKKKREAERLYKKLRDSI